MADAVNVTLHSLFSQIPQWLSNNQHDDSDTEDVPILTRTCSSRSSSRASDVLMSSGHMSVSASELFDSDDDKDDPAVAALTTAHRHAPQPHNFKMQAKDRGKLSGNKIDLSKVQFLRVHASCDSECIDFPATTSRPTYYVHGKAPQDGGML